VGYPTVLLRRSQRRAHHGHRPRGRVGHRQDGPVPSFGVRLRSSPCRGDDQRHRIDRRLRGGAPGRARLSPSQRRDSGPASPTPRRSSLLRGASTARWRRPSSARFSPFRRRSS
jgi:hypothetical protein